MVVKEEVAAVMVQAETRGGEACLQRGEEAEHLGLGSAPAAVGIALELLDQPARMGEDTLRVAGEGLPTNVEAAWREAPHNAQGVHCRLCTGACVNLARLPRHVAHSDVWVLDEQQPDLHPALRRQLRGNRSARRCAHV